MLRSDLQGPSIALFANSPGKLTHYLRYQMAVIVAPYPQQCNAGSVVRRISLRFPDAYKFFIAGLESAWKASLRQFAVSGT